MYIKGDGSVNSRKEKHTCKSRQRVGKFFAQF